MERAMTAKIFLEDAEGESVALVVKATEVKKHLAKNTRVAQSMLSRRQSVDEGALHRIAAQHQAGTKLETIPDAAQVTHDAAATSPSLEVKHSTLSPSAIKGRRGLGRRPSISLKKTFSADSARKKFLGLLSSDDGETEPAPEGTFGSPRVDPASEHFLGDPLAESMLSEMKNNLCLVMGGIPLRLATEVPLREACTAAGMAGLVQCTIRVRPDNKNGSWAILDFADTAAMKAAANISIITDSDDGDRVFLQAQQPSET
eukprot:SAG22_NODE_1472_length_4342_cov_3.211171_3_plen_259_part_00